MRITVQYKKKQYGTGDALRHYHVRLRDRTDLYIANRKNPAEQYYESNELEICFCSQAPAPGRSWDWSDSSSGEVFGGSLELSHDAARQLATTILQFLDARQQGRFAPLEVEVTEKPEPRG